MTELRNAAIGALAMFSTEAVAAEPVPSEPVNEGSLPCVVYDVYAHGGYVDGRYDEPWTGGPSHVLIDLISKQLNPDYLNNDMRIRCLHALVGIEGTTPKSDSVDLDLSLSLPEHRLQNPPSEPLPSLDQTWHSDSAQSVPASEIKASVNAWLAKENVGYFRPGAHYSVPNLGSFSSDERRAIQRQLDRMSDTGYAEKHPLKLTSAEQFRIKTIPQRKDQPACVTLAGNPEYLRISDPTTGAEELVTITEACVPKDELDERVEKAFQDLAQQNKDLAFGVHVHNDTPPTLDEKNHVSVFIVFPDHMIPNQRALWTESVTAAVRIAADYVTSYYYPKNDHSGPLNLIVDFDRDFNGKYSSRSKQLSFNSLIIDRNSVRQSDEDPPPHWGIVRAGGDHVDLPFQEFPGNFDGTLEPGSELSSGFRYDSFDSTPKKTARKMDLREAEEVLAAAMIESLASAFGPKNSTSVDWSTTETSPIQGDHLETSLGLTHACAEVPVGKHGRRMSLGAEWNLPFVNVVGEGRHAAKCTPNFGLEISVAGAVTFTVGTSKD